MKRRDFLRTTSGSVLAAMLPNLSLAKSQAQRPNIVFILADQLRADTLGCAGDKKAITPNIDKFVSQSLNFSNAVSVMPVCAAYRASLLTGKYPSSHGMVINELNMNPNHRTIAHVLRDSGYHLGYVGKWHLNDQHQRPTPKGPERMGFDGFWAAYSFNHQSYNSYYYTDDSAGNLIKISLEGKHGPTEFTDIAINYINSSANNKQPFALFLSWNPPHDPWTRSNVPDLNYKKFQDVQFELPENYKATPDPYMDRYPNYAFNGSKEWKKEFINHGLQECLRCYYAMINNLDERFGRIISKLESLGISDNTIVVLTSDHGEMFAAQGRMFKLTFYDEAARIPFFVRFPGKVKVGTTDACLNTPDVLPTLLGLIGLKEEIPDDVEGKDLSFLLRGGSGIEPEAAFLQGLGHTYQWLDGFEWRAIRDKRFTYAKYRRDKKELLFDRLSDPLMKTDVIDNPVYKKDLNRLRSSMIQYMKSLKDEFHECTWYRDFWMYKDFSIKAGAKGEFGPLPPIEPLRVRN